MTLEVKNYFDPFTGLSYLVFYRPKCVFIEKKLSSKVLILYTVGNFIENGTKNNQRVGSENGLVTSYSCLKILENAILIPLCSWKCSCCNKSDCMQKNLLTFYIKRIWKKTNLRNL